MREVIAIPVMVALAVAVVTDLRSRRIPNWLVLPLFLGGLGASCWIGGWPGLWHSIAGSSLGFGIYMIPFLLGGMGAGDVKLCAAIGAWIWPQQLIVAIVITGMAGGVLAVAVALSGRYFQELLCNTGDLLMFWKKRTRRGGEDVTREPRKQRTIPYSPAIAIGTVISFLPALR